ncbi:flagellin [Roseicyclus mahoneyensis]|uniref:Flagellin n=1 Tax=Roseicyclus mahoneyensis TaxID=164332 RepID=A0A316GGJ5_9RHOB|nr:flagellin [Roseicyclus mahoneyensis]PWK59789.1 flagellin [Roseicyclus mahoneyensis]
MSSILTNTSAMVALQTLKSVNSNLQKTQGEISTGKSVASARDNSAVWAISKVMESDVKGFKGISDSLSLGESTVAVARTAAETVTDLLTDIKGKIVAAQEENVDRGKIQTDIAALRDQITSVVNAAQFNGLNLVKGTEDMNILSSLDRSGSGTVAAANITVARQDLSTAAGTFGTAETDLNSAGFATVGTGTTNSAAMRATTGSSLQIGITAANSESYNITIDGNEFSFTSDADATAAEIQEGFAAAINARGIEGLSVDIGTAGKIILRNTNAFSDLNVTATAGTPGNLIAEEINGVAVPGADANAQQSLVQRATSVNFSASAAVEEGRGFRINLGSDNFTYVAGKGETMEDVARGLKTAIDSARVEGLTAQVQFNSDTNSWQLAVDDAETGGQTLTLVANTGTGAASGGLFGLDNIDVRTNAGADAALDNIETLIQNSIDAAAAFGSAEGRIETQSNFVSKLIDSLKAGIGTLVDANMEEASARLQALQVQQQLATQSLSIANQAPQNILALFR